MSVIFVRVSRVRAIVVIAFVGGCFICVCVFMFVCDVCVYYMCVM